MQELLRDYKELTEPFSELKNVSYGIWIKYISRESGEYRYGGIYIHHGDPAPYIVLKNPDKNIRWSVDLNKNIIYIPKKTVRSNERDVKNKLYNLYLQNRLQLKKGSVEWS